MDPTCRACLQDDAVMVDILCAEVEELNTDLCTLLQLCGNISVNKNDKYPKYLCKECTNELLIAGKFRAKCMYTESVLHKIRKELIEAKENEESLDSECDQHEEYDNQHDLDNVEVESEVLEEGYSEENLEKQIENPIHGTVFGENSSQLDEVSLGEDFIQETLEDNTENNGITVVEESNVIEEFIMFDNTVNVEESVERSLDGEDMPTVEQKSDITNDFENEEYGETNIVIPSILTVDHSFVCEDCGASFSQAQNLCKHMFNIHSSEKLFSCPKCEHVFSTESSYDCHIKQCSYDKNIMHKKLKFRSGEAMPTRTRPQPIHVNASTRPTHTCEYCGKECQSKFALNMHLRTHTGERPFSCPACDKTFKTHSSLKTHSKRHNTPEYVCSICNKTFYEKGNLQVHMRTHTGEKPHVCKFCSKSFTRIFLLQIHMRTHTGEKPYKCERCSRAFSQACDLKNHISLHTGERNHKCTICGKGFIKRRALLLHMQRHGVVKTQNSQQENTDPQVNNTVMESDLNNETKSIEKNLSSESDDDDDDDDDFHLSDFMEEDTE